MRYGQTIVFVSSLVISINSVLLNPRSSDDVCTDPSEQTASSNLLWTRCLNFRQCFIQCYQDTGCSGFWFCPNGSLCLGRSTEYYKTKEAINKQFYDLCRPKVCPLSRGYVYLGESGLCVKFHHRIMKWEKSRSTCQTEGGDLVVLDTELKYHSLQNHIATLNISTDGPGRRTWVGMRRHGRHNYKWVGGHRQWAMWAPSDPSYGAEQCCQISRTGLGDVRCHDPRHCMCELDITA